MAQSTLTIKLVDASTVTMTLVTANNPDAKASAQNIVKSGGFFDDAGVYHPSSAILNITIS